MSNPNIFKVNHSYNEFLNKDEHHFNNFNNFNTNLENINIPHIKNIRESFFGNISDENDEINGIKSAIKSIEFTKINNPNNAPTTDNNNIYKEFNLKKPSTTDQPELFNLLTKSKSYSHSHNFNMGIHPKISLKGRILKSDSNLIKNINNENNENLIRNIPERVENPIYKNFNED